MYLIGDINKRLEKLELHNVDYITSYIINGIIITLKLPLVAVKTLKSAMCNN